MPEENAESAENTESAGGGGNAAGTSTGAAEIKVVRGNPTPEELAAALAVVQVRAASQGAAAGGGARSEWADPARRIPQRRVPRPGAKAWRTTYWPG